MNKGTCYGISVGPGESTLITMEALSIIKSVDTIVLPSFPKEDCRAYQIISRIYPEIDQKNIVCETSVESMNAGLMAQRHQELFEMTAEYLDEGKDVAFLCLGDILLFATYAYVHFLLQGAGYNSKLVNGISSVQAISAALGHILTIKEDELHIFPGSNNIEARLLNPGTKVFMKIRDLPNAIVAIRNYVSETPGAYAYGASNFGMDGEIFAENVEQLSNLGGYFTVIFVVGNSDRYMPTEKYYENRDCKYYPCHKAEHLNCLFCYCPMYQYTNCLGNPSYIERDGKRIKNCTNCAFPHDIDHYRDVLDFLKNQ